MVFIWLTFVCLCLFFEVKIIKLFTNSMEYRLWVSINISCPSVQNLHTLWSLQCLQEQTMECKLPGASFIMSLNTAAVTGCPSGHRVCVWLCLDTWWNKCSVFVLTKFTRAGCSDDSAYQQPYCHNSYEPL